MTADPPGYGTPEDPHGWQWLSRVRSAASAGSSGSDAADLGYDLVLLLGQSNMQGAGGAPLPLLDVAHPRVYSFARVGANASAVVQAVDPLQHPNGNSNGSVGPGMPFARWQVDLLPGNRRILLVPAAYSGAGIVNGNDAHRWDPSASFAAAGIGNSLYESAIAQASAALAAAGPGSRITAAIWAGGEADINADPAAWQAAFEQIIDGLRSRLAVPSLPFIVGGMVPEYAAGGPIDLVQQATPTRKPFTAYVAGPTGYLYSGDGLGVHYTAAGARELGRRLVAGLAAARSNTAPAAAVPASPPAAPAASTPPPADIVYTFGSGAPAGWTVSPAAILSTSGGNLQVPVTGDYQTVLAPDVVDLTAHSVTWRLASVPPATVASSDVFLGVTLGTNTNQDAAGFTVDNGGTPWTAVRVSAAGTRTLDGTDGANRPVGSYRISTSGGNLVLAYSADGASWTTLHTLAAPWPVTAVRPFVIAGHWNAGDPDGAVAVAELRIA